MNNIDLQIVLPMNIPIKVSYIIRVLHDLIMLT